MQENYNEPLKYQQYVQIGKKSFEEIVAFLRQKGKVEELPLNEISFGRLSSMFFNITHSEKWDTQQDKSFRFTAYKFPECSENDEFYTSYHVRQKEYEKYIYVIFEENSMNMECNCTKLLLELCIYEGITKEDADNKTLDFYRHLAALNAYHNKWYEHTAEDIKKIAKETKKRERKMRIRKIFIRK